MNESTRLASRFLMTITMVMICTEHQHDDGYAFLRLYCNFKHKQKQLQSIDCAWSEIFTYNLQQPSNCTWSKCFQV